MDSKLNCGTITFKGKVFNVFRDVERFMVWISEGSKPHFSFADRIPYTATTDEEALKQAKLMLYDFGDLII